jgi:hypothetical protein
MDETISKVHASRLAQAYFLAAARGWVLAPRPITIAELDAGMPLVDRDGSGPGRGIEQGSALIAYFVRRDRIVLPAAIVLVGSKDLLDWARFNVSRSAPGIARETFANADGDTVLVLTAAAGKAAIPALN